MTASEILKLYITQGTQRAFDGSKDKQLDSQAASNATLQVTGAVSWRAEGIKYKKNQVYLDVIESVNLLLSHKGNILRSEVAGKVVLKSQLSGTPELKLGLNDRLTVAAQNPSRNQKRCARHAAPISA